MKNSTCYWASVSSLAKVEGTIRSSLKGCDKNILIKHLRVYFDLPSEGTALHSMEGMKLEQVAELHLKSGSRALWIALLCSLPPLYSVWYPSLRHDTAYL